MVTATDLNAAAAARMLQMAQHFDVMVGTKRIHEFGGRSIGLAVGYKADFPEVADMREAPGLIARAIRRGKGPLFERVQKAALEAVTGEYKAHLSDRAKAGWAGRRERAAWTDRTEEGQTMADRRQALALTQAEFAAKMGVERNTVVRWENGRMAIPRWSWILLGYIEKENA